MNSYDDYCPDVPALLAAQERDVAPRHASAHSGTGQSAAGRLAELARLFVLAIGVKTGVHRRLVYANLRLDWFREFQSYWSTALGNRPIHLHDFYYLSGVYRTRLQTIHFEQLEDPAAASDTRHLEAWRDPRLVYYLFAHTYRLALSPLRVYPYARYLRRGARVAEYGCGAAPIITALARYYRRRNLKLVGADIPHLLFHHARWKFAAMPFVTMVPIGSDDDAPLPGRYDAIFCLETLEHVPRPLAVLRHFHDVLEPGGYLVFDYIQSEGKGLDTASALRDRIPSLEFLVKHFDVVEGRVALDGSHVGPTVARKR